MGTNYRDAPLSDFVVHKKTITVIDGYHYILCIHPKGAAIIIKEKEDESDYLYARAGFGNSEWANKTELEYDTYDKLFVK